ncbi:MAG: hypothetical protein WA749_00565 [Gelidibacter sp.]
MADTEAAALAATSRVGYIFNQIAKKEDQLKMPVWVGEWGNYYENSATYKIKDSDAGYLIISTNSKGEIGTLKLTFD